MTTQKRPGKGEEIKFRTTKELKIELQEMSEKKGISMSALITMWLKERLELEKSG
jgi:hypothetical protein